MRDYWLTKELLQIVGFGFITLAIVLIGLALWLPKKWWHKVIAIAVVCTLLSIPARQSYREMHEQQLAQAAYRVRYAKAKALFDERCKTAGEKIYRTAEGVEGLLLMNERPSNINRSDQYLLDDPYGRDFGGEEYVSSFMWGRNPDGSYSRNHMNGAFRFVEITDTGSNDIRRYRGVVAPRSTGGSLDITVKREAAPVRLSKFGVKWMDISTKTDRDYWIAGSLLQVVDLQTNQVIAERVGYMFDQGLGDQTGGRSPWAYAEAIACPAFEKSLSGQAIKSSRSRAFVLRVLKPIQEGE